MKVLLFLAKGFETVEFSVFVDVIGWAENNFGMDVSIETCGFTKTVMSTFDVPVIVDKTIDEVSVSDYDALAIPGGFEKFGFYEDAYDEKFLEIIRQFNDQGKIIASICVAALALGKAGILSGRNATTYHLMEGVRQKQLAEFGANVINEPMVVDKNIITSSCPATAFGVAFELLKALTSKEDMKKVKEAMGF